MSTSRLSSLDASFLEIESPSAHMHVGWAAAFDPVDRERAPRFEDLRDHVAARMGRAPRYRQRLAGVPLGLHDPVWVDDEVFDVDRHVHRSPETTLGAAADAALSRPLPRDRPLWELWIADRLEDGRVGVVGKAHHAMVDGVAAVELATLLLDPTPDPPAADADGWRPGDAPGAVRRFLDATIDRSADLACVARVPLGLALSPRRAAALPAGALRGGRALLDSVRPAPGRTGLNEPISPRRRLVGARRPLDELREVRSAFDATINDVVLATAAGCLRRFLARRGTAPQRLKAMMPVSVRADGEELGNRISFAFVDLPCGEADPREQLEAVKAEVGTRKRADVPEAANALLRSLGRAPRTLRRALAHAVAGPRAFNLVVSNIPGPREPLYMRGCRLDEVYPVVPLADRHALSIGMTTVGDEAFFGVYADADALPDGEALAGCLDAALDDLLAEARA